MGKKLLLHIAGDIDSVIIGQRFLIKQALFNLFEKPVAFPALKT